MQVAIEFRKNHNNVLKKIKNLHNNRDLEFLNQISFNLVKYLDKKNELRPVYEMTEAGYYSLIVSFSGRKAEVARARLAHEFIRQREFIKKVISEPEIAPEVEIIDDVDLRTELQRAMITLVDLQVETQKQITHQKSCIDENTHNTRKNADEIRDVKNKIRIIKESLTKSRQFNFLNDITTFNIAFPIPCILQIVQVSD